MSDGKETLDEEMDAEEMEQQGPITPGMFGQEVRNLIDLAIQSGMDPETVEAKLEEHKKGTEFYYKDFMRYNQEE